MLSQLACVAVPLLGFYYGFTRGEPAPLVATYMLALSLFPKLNALPTVVCVQLYRHHTLQLWSIFAKGHRNSEVGTQLSWVSHQESNTQRPVMSVVNRRGARLSVA